MKVCIQTGDVIDRVGAEKGYALFKKAGFESIDWNLDHALKIDFKNYDKVMKNKEYIGTCIFEKSLDEVIEHYSKELAIIRENGLEINQAHAPFPAYRGKEYPEFLDYIIEVYKRNIEFCDYVGCKYLVIHGISTAMQPRFIITIDEATELNYKLYRALIPTLQKCKTTKVCLENLFGWNNHAVEGTCSNPNEAIEFIDTLNLEAGKETFCLCLDTGHLNLLNKDFPAYISKLGKRIKALHIHDNNGMSDQHLAPFTGNIDWKVFCDALKSAGFSDDLSFETFAQTNRVLEFDEELLEPWLNVICKTGESFRKKIAD